MKEEILYSAPIEKRIRTERKVVEVERFIEAMVRALANQEQLLLALQNDVSLSEDERRDRMEGAHKTIRAVLDRIAEERKRKDMLEAEIARLDRIHHSGLQILKSAKADRDNAH